jgi:transposase InsO family protein
VARSGFYAWRQRQEAPGKRAAENTRLTAEIQAVFGEHRGFYGSPRIHQELRAAGNPVGRHCVARLMQRAQLRARTRIPFRPCAKASRGAAGVAENLQQQDFQPPAPNRCWAGDITYIRTTAGSCQER